MDEALNQEIVAAANTLADKADADVLLYSGDVERPYDDRQLMAFQRRKNIILILVRLGGVQTPPIGSRGDFRIVTHVSPSYWLGDAKARALSSS